MAWQKGRNVWIILNILKYIKYIKISLLLLINVYLYTIFHYYFYLDNRIELPRRRMKFFHLWLRKLWILSAVDRVFYGLVLYTLYFAVGKWVNTSGKFIKLASVYWIDYKFNKILEYYIIPKILGITNDVWSFYRYLYCTFIIVHSIFILYI